MKDLFNPKIYQWSITCSALLMFLVTSCAHQVAHQEAEPAISKTVVSLEGKQLSYRGTLTKEANQDLFSLYEQAEVKPNQLIVNIGGGEVNLGMDLGDFIYQHQLEVHVEDLCFSSCANYVLTSGKQVYIPAGAFVGFHGGVSTFVAKGSTALKDLGPEAQARYAEYLALSKEREQAFFKRRHIALEITAMGHLPQYQASLEQDDYVGWFFSLAALKDLGLHQVNYGADQVTVHPLRGKTLMIIDQQSLALQH